MAEEKKEIKSAYELALERLGATAGEGTALTAEDKQELAEIDRDTHARIAEQEILFKSRIGSALQSNNLEEAVKLKDELATELRRIRERGEEKKEAVRRRRSEAGAS